MTLIGQGARHLVFSSEPDSVIRVEKDIAKNTIDHCLRKLEFHDTVVVPLFRPFVARQEIVTIGESVVMKTENVIRGSICVELKPKYKGFVFVQKDRGYKKCFNPTGLWSGKTDEIVDALFSATESDKSYMKIHRSCEEVEVVINLVAAALATEKVQDMMKTVSRVSSWACAERSLPIAKKLISKNPYNDANSISIGTFTSLTLVDFISLGHELLECPYPGDQATKWLNTYLTGRMARDISLMFSFSRNKFDLGEGSVFSVSGWWCKLAVVDTDIKPSSKIS